MDHLNFCRQATPALQWGETLHTDKVVRNECAIALITMSKAAKFILPDGGRILPDHELRGLDKEKKLSLPFPEVALEYRVGNQKWITLATELEDDIALQLIVNIKESTWNPTCLVLLSRSNPFTPIDDTFLLNTRPLDEECPPELAAEPAAALISMLNALGCSNVHIERSEPKKAGKKVKSALPFDSYHVLTIDVPGRTGGIGTPTGSHRSPREHLRRGHIRKLISGKKIWVNATVVAAGRGAGIVKKDYALRMAA